MKDRAHEIFEMDYDSPYMLFICDVKKERCLQVDDDKLKGIQKLHQKRSDLPAITHVDYSARVQTVSEDGNPLFHRIIQGFERETKCPVLINTSFNVRGEPIVCTPEDALKCFHSSQIDILVL